MSVIGRLDGQVEEVIINPVGRRRADEDEDAAANLPPSQDSSETTPPEPRERRGDVQNGAAELPVWLL